MSLPHPRKLWRLFMLLNDTVLTSEEIKNEPLDDKTKEANMES